MYVTFLIGLQGDCQNCNHARRPNKFQKEAAQQVSPSVSHRHLTFYKESMHSLISPQEELLVYYNIARCMRSGHGNCTVTGCYRTRNASLVRLKYTCIYLCSVRIVSGLIVPCTFL